MDDTPSFLSTYRKSLSSKIELLKQGMENLKNNYTLPTIEAYHRDVHKITNSSRMYGYSQVFHFCHELDIELLSLIKNFYMTPPSDELFTKLSNMLHKVEKAFLSEKQGIAVPEKKEIKKRVVIVDDDNDIIKLLQNEFHDLGFDVESFQTGNAAIEFLMKEENLKDVFLLVLDRMLPDMDGMDILQKFTKKFPGKVPVLILSVLSSEADVIQGLQGGAIDYIAKPFSVFMFMQKAINLMKAQS